MNFSIRMTIQGLVAASHRLSCSSFLWQEGVKELRYRGDGRRESGAFLLGKHTAGHRRITDFVFYDDLDPQCLDTNIILFDGAGYGPLWQICREKGLEVVADVHTHCGRARQSHADRDHPMLAKSGHVALIVPYFARQKVGVSTLGVYEYQGNHRWKNYSGPIAKRFFLLERGGSECRER